MSSFERVLGDTWCWIEDGICIPVFFLAEKQVVLLDSGLRSGEDGPLAAFLRGRGLSVRAVLTSHVHIDHTGCHALLRERFGAEIIASPFNAAALESPLALKAYFYEDTYQELLRHWGALSSPVDRLILPGQAAVAVDGASFEVLPLPGHSPDHMGFVTPDGVCYLADLLLTDDQLRAAKLPYVMCLGQDLESKRAAGARSAPTYLLAHCGAVQAEDLHGLILRDLQLWKDRLALLLEVFSGGGELGLEAVVSALLQALGLSCRKAFAWMASERTVRAMVQYLVDAGCLEKLLPGTRALYRRTEKPLADLFPELS